MKKETKKIVALLLLCFGITTAQAQQATITAGGNASGSGGTVAYSVGQVVYTTNSSASGTISQGVQQAYQIFTIGIKETELNISLSVFPNPTSDKLTLEVKDYSNQKLMYQLFDLQGKLLKSEMVVGNQTYIEMSNLPMASYFINIIQDNKKVQSFKIIKQ